MGTFALKTSVDKFMYSEQFRSIYTGIWKYKWNFKAFKNFWATKLETFII